LEKGTRVKNLEPWLQHRLNHLKNDDFARCRDWLHSVPEGKRLEPGLNYTSNLSWAPDQLKADLDARAPAHRVVPTPTRSSRSAAAPT
jgi:hypothetical protein